MSDITIKKMTTEDEILGKAFVHFKSWHESYSELVDADYLRDNVTLAKCVDIARTNTENVLVAKIEGRVAGFVAQGKYRGDDLPRHGEIYAIYVLEEYKRRGVGRALMAAALKKLEEYDKIALWVFKENPSARAFYERCGFRCDGAENTFVLGTPLEEVRMIYERSRE